MESAEKFRQPLSRDEINARPLWRYEGPIELVQSPNQVAAAAACLRRETVLGFDTETRPTFRPNQWYPPALLQLAAADRVFLFQLTVLDFAGTDTLRELLADPAIVKAGVAVADDLRSLQKLSAFEPAGFVDLGDLARRHKLTTNGLRNLAANLLGLRISKGAQRTNWAARDLRPQQIVYAATDAWISRELYLRFRDLGLLAPPSAPGP